MDRVIFPTRTARTLRERVEARRARENRTTAHHIPQDPPASGDDWYPGRRETISSFSTPAEIADPAPRELQDEWPLPRRAVPVRPTAGSMAVPRRHGISIPGLGTRRPARGSGRASSGNDSWPRGRRRRSSWIGALTGGISTGWRSLDPELQGIARRFLEFMLVVVVITGLAVGLSSGGGHTAGAKAGAAAVETTPTAQVAAPPKPSKPVRIMLLGSDRRSGDSGYRTDVMLLITVDAAQGKVTALSFPRDLVGKIPGYGDGRINIVMGRGGFPLMQDTFADSYGVRPDYYFLINFEGFVGLINSIGGIEVEAAETLEDSCDLPQSKGGICKIKPGKHSMDGATALWYVRSRHSSSDFDRLRRAQEVISGIFNRMISMQAVTRLPELYLQYSQDVETNMSIPQIASLLPTAVDVAGDTGKIERFSIPEYMVADWIMPDGARVLLPDYKQVKEFVQDAALVK